MELSRVEWPVVLKSAAKEYNKDDISGLAAEMAYKFIFALFPFIIFLAAFAGIIGRAIGQGNLFTNIMDYLYQTVPTAADAIKQPLQDVLNSQQGGALSIGAILALWSASGAVGTIMKAFNRAYGVEETRNFVVQKLVAVGLTLVLSLLLVGGFVLLVAGGAIEQWLTRRFGLGGFFTVVWTILRVVLPLIGVSVALALLYWKGPNVEQEFQWLTPGSIVTTLAWFLATVLFGLYVSLIGQTSYSKTYGALWGVLLFLLYLYLASTIILLGAEVNAETTKRYDPATIRDKITDPRKQLPGEQPAPDPRAAREAGVSPQQVTESNRRSAGKLASGQGSAATATAASAARQGGAAPAPDQDEFDDPTVRERLEALRQRPLPSAEQQARLEQARLSSAERAARARATALAFLVSALTALGGVLAGPVRRRVSS